MKRSPWKVGLVGVGRGSGYGRLLADDPRCEVVACCDASEEALGRFQRELGLPDSGCFSDYDDFISREMDIVFIGTPIPVHAEQSIKALDAGVHVLCEVTAASTVEECERVLQAVRRSGKLYMLAENCVFWPFVQEWKGLVQAGRLGDVFYSECEYLHPICDMIVDPETGERRWRAQRPPLHYCSHSLGPILDITGDRIVRAMGLGQGHRVLPAGSVGGIDIQVALFETEKKAIIKLLRSSVVPRHPAIHYYTLQGTKGYVETDRRGAGGKGRLYIQGEMEESREIDCPLEDSSLPESARVGGHGTAEYSLVKHFLEALESGRKPLLDENRAMDMTVPGIIAHRSAMRDGRWLEVPRLGGAV